MATRAAHLVGSTPFDDADEAIDIALDRLGGHLHTVPDGETGDRRNWIIHIIEALRAHPDLEVTRDGDWSDYDRTPVFRVRRGHRLSGGALDLQHVAPFEAAYPVFARRREAAVAAGVPGAGDLAFQVGIPGDFDMALFALGPTGPFRHRQPFADATVGEIEQIVSLAGHDASGRSDVVFQLEIPAELVFVARFPGPLQPVVARWLGGGVAHLAARAPEGTRFGIHLCVGDMNHRALARLRDVAPLVRLANAIVRAWPAGRSLEFIHAPFAAAVLPPPSPASADGAAFYAPLRRLRLPSRVRLIAGFVHESRPLEEQRETLALIESLVGRRVDVATSCGLGRRDRDSALATIDRARELVAEAPSGTIGP
jgi:hypothetical protein